MRVPYTDRIEIRLALGALLFAGALSYLGGCQGGGGGGLAFENQPLGTVDGKEISTGWLVDRVFEFADRRGMYSSGNETQWLTKQATRFLAEDQMAALARKLKLDETDEFKQLLDAKREELLVRDYRSHVLYQDINISDDEVGRFYEANKQDFRQPDRYRFYYIAISKQRRPPLEARRMAEDCYDRLEAGQPFREVAYASSDLEIYKRTQLFQVSKDQPHIKPVILETLERMEAGETSGIAESDDYYYIFHLDEVLAGETAELAQVRPTVRSELFRQEAVRIRNNFRNEMERSEALKVEIRPELLRTRGSSGHDVVLTIRDEAGDELLILTLNDFYALAEEYTDVRDQVEYLYQLAEDQMIKRAAVRDNFSENLVFRYDLALWADHFLSQLYIDERIEDELGVTDEEVRAYLEEHPYVGRSLAQLRCYIIEKHAGVAPNASRFETKAAMMATENEVWDILSQIRAGRDFRVMAKLHSDHPSFRLGGYIGVVFSGPMGRRFDEAAFNLREGEITNAPVELKDGYMLIWVDRKFPPQDLPVAESLRRARDRVTKQSSDEIRENEYLGILQAMEATWNDTALKAVENVVKDMDADTALVLTRKRYDLEK